MSDIIERLRAADGGYEYWELNNSEYKKLANEAADEIEQLGEVRDGLAGICEERQGEIKRLRVANEQLQQAWEQACEAYGKACATSSERYWEVRWRDEKAENERLQALNAELLTALRPFAQCDRLDEKEVDLLVSKPGAVAAARAAIAKAQDVR